MSLKFFRATLSLLLGLGLLLGPDAASADNLLAVTNVTPLTPGMPAQYTLVFTTQVALVPGVGTVTITLPTATNSPLSDFGVGLPSSIEPSAVYFFAGSGVSYKSGPASFVAVDPYAGRIIASPSIALPAGPVALIIGVKAGILNPIYSGNYRVKTATSEQLAGPDAAAETFTISPVLQFSRLSGVKKSRVTVTGIGYTNGMTATLWIDANGDGVLQLGEGVLASVPVADNRFTAAFVVDSRFAYGPNTINALDGAGLKVPLASAASFKRSQGAVSTVPTSGAPGSLFTVLLEDYAPNTALSASSSAQNMANIPLTVPSGTTTDASGTATFSTRVPANAIPGPANLMFTAGTVLGLGFFTVTGPLLSLSSASVVPGQIITISGQAFCPAAVPGGGGPYGVHQVLADGFAMDGVPLPGQATKDLDSGGTLTIRFALPLSLSPGAHQLTVRDDGGRTGGALLTVVAPVLTVSPQSGRAGTTVFFQGWGLAASDNVAVSYGSFEGVATVATDAEGRYAGAFTVPLDAPLATVNTITAVSGLVQALRAVTTHAIPKPVLALARSDAAPGDLLEIGGKDFPAYASVVTLTIGGVGVASATGVTTNGDGAFVTAVLVPGLSPGSVTVTAVVGLASATASITVLPVPVTVPVGHVFSAEVQAGSLVLVTCFNYATGAYQAYVPGLAGNTLTGIRPNSVLYITVSRDMVVRVSDVSFQLLARLPTPVPVGAVVTV